MILGKMSSWIIFSILGIATAPYSNPNTLDTPHIKQVPPKFLGKTRSKQLQMEKNIVFAEENADWLDMSLSDVSEKQSTLRDWLKKNKKPVLLVISATWCPYCIIELPSLASMRKTLFKELGIVTVFIDDILEESKLIPKLQKFNRHPFYVPLYQAPDATEIMKKRGDDNGLPSFILFSPTGKIWMTDSGLKKWDDKKIQKWLLNIIHKNTELDKKLAQKTKATPSKISPFKAKAALQKLENTLRKKESSAD